DEPEMLPRARPTRPRAPDANHRERGDEHDDGTADEAPRSALHTGDARALRSRKDDRAGDEPDGSKRGCGDVEPRLVDEAPSAVQGSDEWRVDTVEKKNRAQDAK